ncbi:hypothetical protein LOTGIDRAFT_113738 [Lottia gigantea]|uniref:NF-kappa-B-repressing factor n=1 Tax=Lottia gigantea TaxID=225164 RepID=V4ANW1_LOTGI|nr:hypothetical protein LOTGIDRAFT_113738 [Lottia gigantea]ESO98857.1 hypothetical protein LOTGIDRAFT_113738 [Lottia gigantea]
MPKKKIKENRTNDPGFWAAGPNSRIKFKVDIEEGTWLHPSEIIQDKTKAGDDKGVVKSKKRKSLEEEVPVPTKSKKRKLKKKKKNSQELHTQNTGIEDVEQLRDEYESNTEWNIRRSFLTEHMETMTLDRLICLSKCFINYEIYGNIYPKEVMLMLTNMKAAIADVIPDRKERLKSQYEVEFVKPAKPESKISDAFTLENLEKSKPDSNCISKFFEACQKVKIELRKINEHLKDFYFRELNDESFDFPLNCMHQTCAFLKVNICWTMKYKTIVDADNDMLSKDSVMEDKEKVSNEIEHGKKLGDSNIGSKLMKKMGWSGGGIGKNQQGRAEPVLINKVVERSGLGADGKSSQKELKNVVFKIVNDYYHSNDDTDIAFAPDFSSFERKVIHDACRKFGLKSKSYGSGDDRYLVISRQRTPQELYQYVLSKGGETHKYKLIPPLLPEFK